MKEELKTLKDKRNNIDDNWNIFYTEKDFKTHLRNVFIKIGEYKALNKDKSLSFNFITKTKIREILEEEFGFKEEDLK